MKVGDLVTWRKEAPRRRGERDPKKGYGLVINTQMIGPGEAKALWIVVKWSNGKTERSPEWLLASRLKVISESR